MQEEGKKAAIINELRHRYPLKGLLQLSGLARSTFYYYLKQQDTDKYKVEKQEILDIFNANKGRYGYHRVLTVLKNKECVINHKTVLKLMNSLNLKGKQRKNDKYHSYKGEVGKIADNLLKCFPKQFYQKNSIYIIDTPSLYKYILVVLL